MGYSRTPIGEEERLLLPLSLYPCKRLAVGRFAMNEGTGGVRGGGDRPEGRG